MSYGSPIYIKGAIVTVRAIGGYFHFGIYDGFGGVFTSSLSSEVVVHQTLQEFLQGRTPAWDYPSTLPESVVVQRAREALGQKWYLTDNCEHFARGCHGNKVSYQLRAAAGAVIALGVACALVPAARRWA